MAARRKISSDFLLPWKKLLEIRSIILEKASDVIYADWYYKKSASAEGQSTALRLIDRSNGLKSRLTRLRDNEIKGKSEVSKNIAFWISLDKSVTTKREKVSSKIETLEHGDDRRLLLSEIEAISKNGFRSFGSNKVDWKTKISVLQAVGQLLFSIEHYDEYNSEDPFYKLAMKKAQVYWNSKFQ